MSPLRNEEAVLDERLPAEAQNGYPELTTQKSILNDEKESSNINFCYHQEPLNPSNEIHERPRTRDTFQHSPSQSTAKDPNPNPDAFPQSPTYEPISCKRIATQGQDDGDTFPEGGLRAWLVVLGSFSGMTASFGILNSAGTFQAYLSMHQLAHESPSAVGWIFSVNAFLTFFCGVQIGPVFDAYGPRWLVFAGTVTLFGGLMGAAESTSKCCLLLHIIPWPSSGSAFYLHELADVVSF